MSKLLSKVYELMARAWKNARAIPPAAGCINPAYVLFFLLFYSESRLKRRIRHLYPDHELYFFSSAKAALTTLFAAMQSTTGRDQVLMSAYTCPDIASAVIRSSCNIGLFDLDETTLEPELGFLSGYKSSLEGNDSRLLSVGALILSNLYGLPDTIPEKLPDGVFLIDDACQSALSTRGEELVGASLDRIGLYSFGRGKALPAAGGGLLIVPRYSTEDQFSRQNFELLNRELSVLYEEIPKDTFVHDVVYLVKVFLIWLFEKPRLFWLPLRIKFLEIGQTKVRMNFEISASCKAAIAAMWSLLSSLESRRKKALSMMEHYPYGLAGPSTEDPLVNRRNSESVNHTNGYALIRYPLIVKPILKKRFEENEIVSKSLGISTSYPLCIYEYEDFEESILGLVSSGLVNINQDNSKVDKISKSILTIPVHRYISHADADLLDTIFSNAK